MLEFLNPVWLLILLALSAVVAVSIRTTAIKWIRAHPETSPRIFWSPLFLIAALFCVPALIVFGVSVFVDWIAK